MRALSHRLAGVLLSLAPLLAGAETGAIEREIAELSVSAGGVVGVAAWRLDGRGARILVNAQEPMPMASTYKIAIAGAVLASVDAGRMDLQQMVAIERDRYVSSDVIAESLIHPGVSLSVHNLIELMLVHSDNTATDILMELTGGAQGVNQWLRLQGISGQRIDRNTASIIRDFFGVPPQMSLQDFEAAARIDPRLDEKGGHPDPAFDSDPRDTSTPLAMSQLLQRIFSGEALSPASTALLAETMVRCRTGADRIRGRLPEGTIVANKTGTIGGTVNDVGVITLPGRGGRIVISVLIKGSDAPYEKREAVIAEIARSVRDYYLLVEP